MKQLSNFTIITKNNNHNVNIRVWNSNGELIRTITDNHPDISKNHYSINGKYVISGYIQGIDIYDTAT